MSVLIADVGGNNVQNNNKKMQLDIEVRTPAYTYLQFSYKIKRHQNIAFNTQVQ